MSGHKSIVYFLSCDTPGANIPKFIDEDDTNFSHDIDDLDAAVGTQYMPAIAYLPRQAPPPLSRWKMMSTCLLRCTSFAEQRRIRAQMAADSLYVPPHTVGILVLPFISRGFVPEMRFLLDTFVAKCVNMKKRYLLILTTCRDSIDDGKRCIARIDVLRIILAPWLDVLARLPLVVMTKFGVQPFNHAQRRLLSYVSVPESNLFDKWKKSQNEALLME